MPQKRPFVLKIFRSVHIALKNADRLSIMIRCRFLIAACVGTLFYVVLSFVGGRDGLWATEQMQRQKMLLSVNTAEIQHTNDQLSMEKIALQKDMDMVAAYAKRLGYIHEGEKLVKISGLATNETQIYDAGTVLKHTESEFIPERLCKGVGVIVFLLLYLVLLLFDYSRGLIHFGSRKIRYATADGTAMYDMR